MYLKAIAASTRIPQKPASVIYGVIVIGALLIAWAVGATQATGVEAALWSAVASLIAFELLAGIRARAGRSPIGPGELVLDAGVGITMGLAILLLRIVLH